MKPFVPGWLAACLFASGCLDLSPVAYHGTDSVADSGVNQGTDAGTGGQPADAAVGSSTDACRMCIETGPCSEAFDTCNADMKCSIFAHCMTDTGCWSAELADLANIPTCVTECGRQAMFVSQVDPSSGLIIPVLICAQDSARCGPACAPD
jgi:hypothetical protein